MSFTPVPLDPRFTAILQPGGNLVVEVASGSSDRDIALELLVKNGLNQGQTILLICPGALVPELHTRLAAFFEPATSGPQIALVPRDLLYNDPRSYWDSAQEPYIGIASIEGMFDNLFAPYYGHLPMPNTQWIPTSGLLITVGFDRCKDRREQAQFQLILPFLRGTCEASILQEVMLVQPLQNLAALAAWFDAGMVRLQAADAHRQLDSALTDPELCAELLERFIGHNNEWVSSAAFALFSDATFGATRDTIHQTVATALDELELAQRIFCTRRRDGTWRHTVRPPQERYVLRSASPADRAYFAAIWGGLPTLSPFDVLVVAGCAPDLEQIMEPTHEPEAAVIDKLTALPSELLKHPVDALQHLLRVPPARLWGALQAALVAWASVQGADAASIALSAGIEAASIARLKGHFRRELYTIAGTTIDALALNALRAQAMLHLVSGVAPAYGTLAMIPALTTPMLQRIVADGYTNLAHLLVGDPSRDLHREEWDTFRAILERRVDLLLSVASLNDDLYDVDYSWTLVVNALFMLVLESELDYQVGFLDSSGTSLGLLRLLARS